MCDKRRILIAAGLLVAGCGGNEVDSPEGADDGEPRGASVEVVSQRVQPSDTGSGIRMEPRSADYHYVAQPRDAADRKDVLLVFLVGSLGSPDNQTEISDFAAGLGFGVLDLRYPNQTVVGVACAGRDECFGQYRGETVFGQNVEYAPGQPGYDAASNVVDRANSIVNRVASLIDFLASQGPFEANPDPGYWAQFLVRDDDSPYVVPGMGNVYPDWSRIIVAGHSQGGGHAPMLAINLPPSSPARRVVMFAAPNDNTGMLDGNRSVSWITAASATPMERFWGLRHEDDQDLGGFVSQNWENMGGPEGGGVGGSESVGEVVVGDGSGDPEGSHRLVLTQPEEDAHNSTAVDGAYLPEVKEAWRYLLTGGGAD